MISHSEWFNAIKQDIKNNYKIKDPEFFVDGIVLSFDRLEKWIEKVAIPPDLWVKYRWLKENSFELKPFTPDPPDEISYKIMNDLFEILPQDKLSNYFTATKFVNNLIETLETNVPIVESMVPGDKPYNQKEIVIELRSLLRRGYSKIIFEKDTTREEDKIVYHLRVEQDSLENMLKSGYLVLEYSDC